MARGTGKDIDRKQDITPNMEDYLKAIHELSEESGAGRARVTDIGKRLGVTRPSVVGMLKHLAEHELVTHDHYGAVELTDVGAEVAKDMADRHRVLRNFLEEVLGLDADLAEDDACRMEHTLSAETIERFMALEAFREKEGHRTVLDKEGFRKFLRKRKLRIAYPRDEGT